MIMQEVWEREHAHDALRRERQHKTETRYDVLCSMATKAQPAFMTRDEALDMAKLAFMWAMPLTRTCAQWAHGRYAHDPPRQLFLEKMIRVADVLWGERWDDGLGGEADWDSWVASA